MGEAIGWLGLGGDKRVWCGMVWYGGGKELEVELYIFAETERAERAELDGASLRRWGWLNRVKIREIVRQRIGAGIGARRDRSEVELR